MAAPDNLIPFPMQPVEPVAESPLDRMLAAREHTDRLLRQLLDRLSCQRSDDH